MSTTEKIQPLAGGPADFTHLTELFTATGATDPVMYAESVTVSLTGTATAVTVVVERNPLDPAANPARWAPAEDEVFSGNLTTGISPRVYDEPAKAFWRVRVASITGGNCHVSMVGVAGQ